MRQHNVRVTGSLLLNGSNISSQGSINTASLATTGSNTFVGNQIVTGSIDVSGSIFVGGENVVSASQLTSISSSIATTISASAASQLIYSSSVDSRLDIVEATASLYVPFSTSVDSRLDILELSSSLYDNVMSGSLRLYVSPDGKDTNDGSDPSVPFKTIKAAVESLGNATAGNIKRYTIFVGSGNYTENNPIAVPPGVAIVGDTLRTVRLTAQNPTKDYFHCHDSNYFYGLRFLDLKHPAFCFSFPCSTATCTIGGGSITGIDIVHSMTGYTDGNFQDIGIVIEGPDASGSIATATANIFGGVITQINVSSGGTNYTTNEKPHISIPAPASKRPIIGTSPYVQNCSSITGPFTTIGQKIPVTTPLPYNINNVFGGNEMVNAQGAGGGIRIDGNLVSGSSPLESFVADAFTQVNQGGPGHLVINKGYAQFVSCFTTFCTYGYKVANGGFANISNSVIDFGNKGLISKTYFPTAYNTGSAVGARTSTVTGFTLSESGSGYTGSVANVTITEGGASVQATAEAKVVDGAVTEIILLTPGSGYTSQPTASIAPPTGANPITATGSVEISGISEILFALESATRGVDISSNMILNGSDYLVTAVANVDGQPGQRKITTFPAPPSIADNATVKFHQLSNISTGGLVMEYVGSGVTYNALPKFGGVPIRTMEINEIAPGRVFYTTVDNIGNIKVGDYFAVNQLTGEVTINSNSFNLSGLNAIGPFKRNGNSAGVVLQEVSDNTNLLNSAGLNGQDTVPTQYAVKNYVDGITDSLDSRLDSVQTYTASVSTSVGLLQSTASYLNTTFSQSVDSRLDIVEATASLYIPLSTSVDSRLDIVEATASLYIPLSTSVDSRLNSIQTYTASVSTSVGLLESTASYLNTTFSTSVDSRLDIVEATASLYIPFSTSVDSKLASIQSVTSSYATTGSNTFRENQIISGSLTVTGNLNVFETASFITVTSSVILGGNTIQLNTFSPAVRFGGISVIDSGSTGLTGSILWDSEKDKWIYSNPSGGAYDSAMLISGPKNTSGLGNELGLVNNYIMKAVGDDHISSSQMQDDGITVTIPNTASIGNIVGLGSPTTFSSSVDYRISILQGGEQGSTTQILALNEKVNAISPYTASVIALNTYTASVSTSVGLLESTASYLNTTFSQSVNNRLVSLATTGSNIFTGNQTISGSLTISGSAILTGSTRGNVVSMSISNNTASIDFSRGNMFTLVLPGNVNTLLQAQNIRAGQTVSLLVTQPPVGVTGSLRIRSPFTFPTGSQYTSSTALGKSDILTFVTFDDSTIHTVAVKSMTTAPLSDEI